VLHRALTGAPPFEDLGALGDVLDGTTPLPDLPDDVPEDLRAIVRRAMTVERAGRHASALELGEAIARARSVRELDAATSHAEVARLAIAAAAGRSRSGTKTARRDLVGPMRLVLAATFVVVAAAAAFAIFR
ncbi:MAG: hypothetical protein ACHREM_07000, partial [Polyangiales bacterium]